MTEIRTVTTLRAKRSEILASITLYAADAINAKFLAEYGFPLCKYGVMVALIPEQGVHPSADCLYSLEGVEILENVDKGLFNSSKFLL